MNVSTTLTNGLALSGGGFRATLFALGSLWRLNELGWLRRLDVITSVSGGSIANALLACRWPQLTWSDDTDRGMATNFPDVVAAPLQQFCAQSVDVAAGLQGLLSWSASIPDEIEKAYRDHLFGALTLQDLPAPQPGKVPRFMFYATSLQTGSSVRISREYLADYKLGMLKVPQLSLAKVVGASSAFPPVLSPVKIDLNPDDWTRVQGASFYDHVEMRRTLLLTDGGVYDNMGLEAIWDRCRTVLVCDAGAPFNIEEQPKTDWAALMLRVQDITTEQTRALRRRKLIDDYRNHVRGGGYWGISTDIGAYAAPNLLAANTPLTRELRNIRTRLNPFQPAEQGHLINWGYALTDAAVRSYVDDDAPGGRLPCPDFPLA